MFQVLFIEDLKNKPLNNKILEIVYDYLVSYVAKLSLYANLLREVARFRGR